MERHVSRNKGICSKKERKLCRTSIIYNGIETKKELVKAKDRKFYQWRCECGGVTGFYIRGVENNAPSVAFVRVVEWSGRVVSCFWE